MWSPPATTERLSCVYIIFQKEPKGHLENLDHPAQKPAEKVNFLFPGLYAAHFPQCDPFLFCQRGISFLGSIPNTTSYGTNCSLPSAKLCFSCITPHLELCTTFQDFHLSPSKCLGCSLWLCSYFFPPVLGLMVMYQVSRGPQGLMLFPHSSLIVLPFNSFWWELRVIVNNMKYPQMSQMAFTVANCRSLWDPPLHERETGLLLFGW